MKKTKKIRSAIPIYLFGLTWIIYGLIFPLYKLAHVLTALLISCIVFVVTSIIIPARTIEIEAEEKFKKTGDKDADDLIREGQNYIKQMKEYNSKVYDPILSRRISRMVVAATAIFKEVSENPSKETILRNFGFCHFINTQRCIN